jgi:hypothetical protein
MTEYKTRTFNNDQASNIIRKALSIKKIDTINYQELLEIGQELGIDPSQIQEAIHSQDSRDNEQQLRDKWMSRQRDDFREHLWAFIIINFALVLIDLLTYGGWWFQWPLLCWGIGLAFHYRETYYPGEEQIEKGIQKMRRKQQRSLEKMVSEP